jgi:hypothetical protein
MPGTLRHFAINSDDVARSKAFYGQVFDWTFQPWGPPGFYQITNAGGGLLGALQGRREIEAGVAMPPVEVTMGVDDIEATMAAIEAAGGRIAMRPFYIQGVGRLIFFADPDGNLMGAMQYDPGVFD